MLGNGLHQTSGTTATETESYVQAVAKSGQSVNPGRQWI